MTNLSSLESVNNAITECMDKDEQPWDYYEQLQSSQNGKYYYNSKRLIKLNEISIPKAISDSIHHHNNRYFGGFFESINRAYFVINSSIYLWDYSNNGQRWCCLNQFNDRITCLSLVESKTNIFIDKIQYLLIVATKIEIIVIGIGFTNNGEIEAFPTKYKISTDGALINKIICDKEDTKRIFLCCNQGNVYEFEYFYKQNLFGQHIRKCLKTNISDSFTSKLFKSFAFPQTNIDDSDNNNNNNNNHLANDAIIDIIIHNDIFYTKCLFSLSAKGEINGYKFDDNCKILRYNKLWNEVQLQIQQMTDDNRDALRNVNDLKIIKLFAINKYESQQCQLMAITTNGDRLFFTISQSSHSWHCELAFIRIRPPFLNYNHNNSNSSSLFAFEPAIQPSSSPRNVLCCFHDKYDGVTLMNSLRNNHSSDTLLLISRNNVETIKSKYIHRNQLIESIESDLDSTATETKTNFILSLCSMPKQLHNSLLLYSRKEIKKLNAAKPFIGLSQFAVQHLLPCSIYLCLRQKSIVFYKLLRYIDEFKTLLRLKNYENILNFIDKIGLIECEVMCLLILIERNSDCDTVNNNNENNNNNNDDTNMMINEAHKLFTTPFNHKTDNLYQDIMQRLACNSTKVLSIFLCLSRILRPIWCSTICIVNIENNHHISARYSVEQLYQIMKPLISFKNILNELQNIGFSPKDIQNIQEWLAKCIEILNVLIMFTRCHFNNIYDQLSNESQNLLKHICFEQLISKQCGYELLSQIISRMVPKLNDNDIKRLHKECPTYFSSAQLVTFLAKSQLTDKMKSNSTLETSLTMFCNVCDDAAFDLHQVCDLLRKANYYHGVCKLIFCLQNKLILKINELNNKPTINYNQQNNNYNQQLQQMQYKQQQTQQLNNRIMNAWNEIFECLQILYFDTAQNEQFLSHSKERVLRLCLMETNRDFAYKFFEWFLDNKLINILFKYKPQYLEEFLSSNENLNEDQNQNETEIKNNEKKRNNRLIKLVHFYKANGEMKKMIHLLDALTKSNGFELEERNNFLIEAKRATKTLQQNIDSFDPHNVINDKYNKFEEKSILCQIQLNLLNELRQNGDEAPLKDLFEHKHEQQELYNRLNYRLLNLEKIYELARKYKLAQRALDCLSFSNDPKAVRQINGCWFLWIGQNIEKHRNEWTQYVSHNLYKIVNKYNLEQQPFMFDVIPILLYLHNVNFKTQQNPSHKVILDIIYPKIAQIKYIQLIDAYKAVLNQVDVQYKINIIQTIEYLLTQKPRAPNAALRDANPSFNDINDPRLFYNRNHNNLSFISSTSNVQDLISKCIYYLEQTQQNALLTKRFQNLSQQYSL